MNWARHMAGAIPVSSSGEPCQKTARIVAVGDVSTWQGVGTAAHGRGRIVFAEFHDLDQAFLALADPSLVVSPLIARRFDCVDLAELLGRLAFRGRYRAIAADLPHPHLIEAEIRSVVPHLDFAVVPMARLKAVG